MDKKDNIWLYGNHACRAALRNPKRKCNYVMIEISKQEKYREIVAYCRQRGIQIDFVDRAAFRNIIAQGVNHQGIAVNVLLLSQLSIKDLEYERYSNSVILILDHITDSQNFGNVLRSAAAFDVTAVIVPKDNSVGENAVAAKVASGALDLLPIINVTNINSTIIYLKTLGYWCYGLDQDSDMSIGDVKISEKALLILGSEGEGIKRLSKKKCDFLVNIPINLSKMESLNVANAASIMLFDIYFKNLIR